MTHLEHVNITVSDVERTAAMLVQIFGWRIRWRGGAISSGECIHVGGDNHYISVYRPAGVQSPTHDPTQDPTQDGADLRLRTVSLNHLGVVVDDLDETERRVVAAGLTPFNHGGYEPGRRFYFLDADRIEWEVIAYPPSAA